MEKKSIEEVEKNKKSLESTGRREHNFLDPRIARDIAKVKQQDGESSRASRVHPPTPIPRKRRTGTSKLDAVDKIFPKFQSSPALLKEDAAQPEPMCPVEEPDKKKE